jgi:hypothetical protein
VSEHRVGRAICKSDQCGRAAMVIHPVGMQL